MQAKIQHLNQVLMAQSSHCGRLTLKTLDKSLVFGHGVGHNFDGYIPVKRGLIPFVYDCHAAASDGVQYAVAAQGDAGKIACVTAGNGCRKQPF